VLVDGEVVGLGRGNLWISLVNSSHSRLLLWGIESGFHCDRVHNWFSLGLGGMCVAEDFSINTNEVLKIHSGAADIAFEASLVVGVPNCRDGLEGRSGLSAVCTFGGDLFL